ncbi:MAG: fibrobacter succinogenes major paralogous domain-containing protein [Bacteroidota bacterium]|jgi:uncharacterized protein (TIGR02145 family)
MKKITTLLFSFLCLGLSAQIQQNINKTLGTVTNPISEIDSIRFDVNINQMVVVTNSGSESHALSDIINVTFSTANLIPCSGGVTSVTDIDGNVYNVVQIGDQCWTKENLRTTRYNNGSVIPNVTGDSAWQNLTTPAWCNYNNSPSNDAVYGKLYNWYTVAAGNMCPTGWHVPTDTEWTVLTDYLGGASVAGGKMKSTTGWNAPNTGATNESGFSGLPGSVRNGDDGNFSGVGNGGCWWSSTETSVTSVSWVRCLFYNFDVASRSTFPKPFGLSVRCLRD